MQLIDRVSGNEFVAQRHNIKYQPPRSISEFRALSRELLLNGDRVAFYFGETKGTRVSFKLGGVWYKITCSNPGDQPENLYDVLRDLGREFEFVTDGE